MTWQYIEVSSWNVTLEEVKPSKASCHCCHNFVLIVKADPTVTLEPAITNAYKYLAMNGSFSLAGYAPVPLPSP